MFGKEQPDVVTEEEVGDYIEQLKKDGLVELDYAELELKVLATTNEEQRNLSQHDSFVDMYGGGTNELVRLSENSTSGTQVKK